MRRSTCSGGPWARIAAVNARARWTIGILLALVVGLAVGLVIVAGDDSNDSDTNSISLESTPTTVPQSTVQTTTQGTISTTTNPSGGTPVPGGTTSPGGSGGL
jgi:hypothetical protein